VFDEALARPAHGARLIVKLEPAAGGDGRYVLLIATPEAEWRGDATVREADGAVTFGAWSAAEPEPWVVQAAHALLRSAWQRRRSGNPWPRRLARWRPLPGAAEGE
jgi:hypothetical protein